MLNRIRITLLLAIFLITTGLIGCSKMGDSPVANVEITDASTPVGESNSFHKLWGIWNIQFDGNHASITVETARTADAHFDITDMLLPPVCDDCITIEVISFDPATRVLDLDVNLRNPYQISGYDIRGILYTNDYGHKLLNADDWTKLWEIPGGMELNPFKAFAKETPDRIFAAGAEHAENYLLYVPDPANYWALTFAVDVSFPGNCNEPYEIKNFWQEEIGELIGSKGSIFVDVYDWQENVSEVILEAPEITGWPAIPFEHITGNTWGLEITNNQGADWGDYEALITAKSTDSGELALYDYINIHITAHTPTSMVDVTPPGLSFTAYKVCIESGYAYTVGLNYEHNLGFHVFDVSDPLNPVCVGQVDTPDGRNNVDVLDGYAYIVDREEGLIIIDVDPPESPEIVHTLEMPGMALDVAVCPGYAYVADVYNGVHIIDISTPESAFIMKSLETPKAVAHINYSDGLVFAIGSTTGAGWLYIIDANPPELAYILNTVDITDFIECFEVTDGYAYVSSRMDGFWVVDIDPPESAHVVTVIECGGGPLDWWPFGIEVSDGYAYVADSWGRIWAFDIDPPESAFELSYLAFSGDVQDIALIGDYAYIGDGRYGLQIADISQPDSLEIVKRISGVNSVNDVAISGDYAFAADSNKHFCIIDISQPESAYLYQTLFINHPYDIVISGDYAYVTASHGLYVADISQPESVEVVLDYQGDGPFKGVCLYNDYILTAEHYWYYPPWDPPYCDISLMIIHADIPDSLNFIKEINYTYQDESISTIAVHGSDAFVTGGDYPNLRAYDLDPPEDMSFSKTILTPGKAGEFEIIGEYAFVADGEAGLQIIDIDPLQDAHIVKSVDLAADVHGLDYYGGYAFVTSYDKLIIIDCDPIESAYVADSIGTPGRTKTVTVAGGYAYVADYHGGLRIIKLL